MIEINYLAVGVAGVVSFVLGGLWYGPVFGKTWIGLSGMTPEQMLEAKKKSMLKSYILTFVGSLFMAGVLSQSIIYAIGFLQKSGLSVGVSVAFCSWLGFIAPVTLGKVLWENKPWKFWLIDNGYYLISLLLMASIITFWM